MEKPRLYISSHQTASVHNDFGGTGRPFPLWRTLSVTNVGETVKADGSSITECSLCSSAVHLSRDPRAACDPNGAARMIRLTTPTEGYTPYQGSEGRKSFPLLKDWFLTAHCSLHQREANKDLMESPNLDPGYTVWCAHLSNKTTRIPTKCSFYSTERMS